MSIFNSYKGRFHVAAGSRVSGRRADNCQPVHPACSAFCLRSHRAAVYAQWLAAVSGDGGDVRPGGLTGCGGRRLGGASQSIRALARVAVRCPVRAHAVAAETLGATDAAIGGRRQSFVGGRRGRCQTASGRVVPDRRGHRFALGALRRANPGAGADRRRAARGQHRHYLALAGLRRRGCHLPGLGLAGRR